MSMTPYRVCRIKEFGDLRGARQLLSRFVYVRWWRTARLSGYDPRGVRRHKRGRGCDAQLAAPGLPHCHSFAIGFCLPIVKWSEMQ